MHGSLVHLSNTDLMRGRADLAPAVLFSLPFRFGCLLFSFLKPATKWCHLLKHGETFFTPESLTKSWSKLLCV